MATVPSGYTAGSPVNGVIPLYSASTGQIAGTIQNGQTHYLGSEAEKSAAYAFPSEIGVSGGTGAGTGTASPSYLSGSGSGSGGGGGSGNMTWNDIAQTYGYGADTIAQFQAHGWSPELVQTNLQKQGIQPQAQAAATPQQNAFGIKTISTDSSGNRYVQNTQGQVLGIDPSGNYFTHDASGNNVPLSDTYAQTLGFQSTNPETQAQKQMAAIDPASETLRSAVAQSYLTPLQQQAAGGPNAQQLQSYLDTYKQLDPAGYASMTSLGGSEDASLKQATDQLALGSQLDPVTARQVEQQTRMGQAARGNVYGTPQMVQEAMTTGQAGLSLQAQRQAAAQAAQGNMLSYLSSGQTAGGTALNLYNQNQNNLRASQSAALGYLGSGQTPYQVGASYLSNAEGAAANAAQGGPVYQPAALGQSYSGTAAQAPQYGLDIGNQATNWYNSLSANQGSAAPVKNKGVSAATGALSGAASGAMAGSAAGPYGTLIGGAVGAIGGGLSGYYS